MSSVCVYVCMRDRDRECSPVRERGKGKGKGRERERERERERLITGLTVHNRGGSSRWPRFKTLLVGMLARRLQ